MKAHPPRTALGAYTILLHVLGGAASYEQGTPALPPERPGLSLVKDTLPPQTKLKHSGPFLVEQPITPTKYLLFPNLER